MPRNQEQILTQIVETPVGTLLLGAYAHTLCLCDWFHCNPERHQQIDRRIQRILGAQMVPGSSPLLHTAATQLKEYFEGRRTEFSIPLQFAGTAFQKQVWSELLSIPYGETISYAQLAEKIQNPRAVRAVASANRANALSIFVPCHRVIGSNGQLVGYAGNVTTKRMLLQLESSYHSTADSY